MLVIPPKVPQHPRNMQIAKTEKVRDYLLSLQNRICTALESSDGQGKFLEENWGRDEGGGVDPGS